MKWIIELFNRLTGRHDADRKELQQEWDKAVKRLDELQKWHRFCVSMRALAKEDLEKSIKQKRPRKTHRKNLENWTAEALAAEVEISKLSRL